jgi:hypothetical protein
MAIGEIQEVKDTEKKPKRTIYGKNLIQEGQELTDVENLLTKSDILKGKDKRKTVHLDHYDKTVVIRPLTDGELTEVFELIGNVPVNEDGLPDLSLVDISTNLKALRLVTMKGLVDPKLGEDEIAQMRFGIPGLIAQEVMRLSGLTEEAGEGDTMRKFRGEP